jgi:cellobiose phosphorylase
MFIETEYAGDGLLIAHRRLQVQEDAPIWAAHLLVGAPAGIQFETDRETFLGRGNSPASAHALYRELNGSSGTVVDPVFSLRCRMTLAPRDRMEFSFLTLVASSREDIMTMAAKYRRPGAVTQAFEMMWTRSQLEFRYLGIGSTRAHRFQELASYLVFPNIRLRSPDRIARNRMGQSGLWALGVSGDLPIMAVTLADDHGLNVIRELLQAHQYWRMRGFRADFLILNQEIPSYDSPLRHQLQKLIDAHSIEAGIDKPGGVFLRDWHPMPEDVRNLILAAASVVLSANRESLQQQLSGICRHAIHRRRPFRRTLPAVALPRTSLFQRARWIHQGRARIRHLFEAWRQHSRSLGKCHGACRFRRHGQRERIRLHLAREQPDEPSDAME